MTHAYIIENAVYTVLALIILVNIIFEYRKLKNCGCVGR